MMQISNNNKSKQQWLLIWLIVIFCIFTYVITWTKQTYNHNTSAMFNL